MITINVTVRFLPCETTQNCLHVTCLTCGTPMRQGRQRAADHQNTRVGNWPKGQCTSCVTRVSQPRRNHHRPDHCINCSRKVRPNNTSLADFPGTIAYGGKGKCCKCYAEARAAQNPYRGDCNGCGRPMRPAALHASHLPGSRIYKRDGQCIGCYRRVQNGNTETVLEEQARKTKAAKNKPKPRPKAKPKPKPTPTAAMEERGMVDLEELKHLDLGAYRFTLQRRERQAKKLRAQKLLTQHGGPR